MTSRQGLAKLRKQCKDFIEAIALTYLRGPPIYEQLLDMDSLTTLLLRIAGHVRSN